MIRALRPFSFIAGALVLVNLTCAGAEPPARLVKVDPIEYPSPEVLTPKASERLRAERAVFAREIRNILSWNSRNVKDHVPAMDPATVQGILKRLQEGAKNTVQDNVKRFAEALGERIPSFGEACDMLEAGKPGEAAAAMEPLMQEVVVFIKANYQHNTLPPMCYAVVRHLHSEALGAAGDQKATVIGYQIIVEMLPDNLSLSATARKRAGELYLATARVHYAVPFFEGLARVYAPYFNDEENLRLWVKVRTLYRAKDPYRKAILSSAMIHERLRRQESGVAIQRQQKELIDLFNEMLNMPEEEGRPFLEATHTISQGGEEGSLEEGGAPDSLLLTNAVEMGGGDDWGKLRPREKQKIIEAFKQTYPERYSRMLEAYYQNLSKAEAKME